MAFLVTTGPIGLGVNPIASVAATVITAAFFVLFIRKVVAARRQPAFVGGDSMVGAVGQVRRELAPEGLVFVQGALWKAIAESPIPTGSTVRVLSRNGLELQVAPENGHPETKEEP
jgi:membrane-bound serine protease (ClpP class)